MWRAAWVLLAVLLVSGTTRAVPVRESASAGMEASALVDASEMRGVDGGLRELPGARDLANNEDDDEEGESEADDTSRSFLPFPPAPSLVHTHKHVEGSGDGAAMPGRVAWSEGGREEMAPRDRGMLDGDCDSPQLGEEEDMPQSSVDIDMNGRLNATQMPEQGGDEREALLDADDFEPSLHDAPIANARFENSSHPSTLMHPVDERFSVTALPLPSREVLRGSKCSRNTNGNDVPPALDDLGEDCGMPEPVIECETLGNSTLCAPHLVLVPPPVPVAEIMPPIPPPHVDPARAEREVNVEFVDFGASQVAVGTNESRVGAIVREAGKRFGVEASDVLTMHNAGASVGARRQLWQLEDPHQLIVYLKCAHKAHFKELLVKLPDCATAHIEQLEVHVEVPETNNVFTVDAVSTDSVDHVLRRTPVPPSAVGKVTYNGKRLDNSTTLDQLGFVSRSALVVYLLPVPVLTSPLSNLPSSSASSSSFGVEQDTTTTTSAITGTGGEPDVSQLGRPVPDPVPIPPIEHDPWPRPEMTQPAVVTMRVEGDRAMDFPVRVQPTDKGLVLIEAVHERVGSSFKQINVVFHALYIRQETELKSFGFRDGDVVVATVLW